MAQYNVQGKALDQKKISSSNLSTKNVQLRHNSLSGIIQMAKINPQMLTQNDVMVLQRTMGNGAVCQLINGTLDKQNRTAQKKDEKLENNETLQMKVNTNLFQRVNITKEKAPIQGKFEGVQKVDKEEPVQMKKENNTGLPDNLKAGVENLSGLAMDDVRVHYNSDKPSQVGALAYTQGTDIHVAPGQEKHLAHEAWHVVQQAQGRVQATTQMKGVAVNDDVGLEKEADEMGEMASENNVYKAEIFEEKRLVQGKFDIVHKMDDGIKEKEPIQMKIGRLTDKGVIQRIVTYNGNKYKKVNWEKLWEELQLNTPPEDLKALFESKKMSSKDLIMEICSEGNYNLGNTREGAQKWLGDVVKGTIGLTAAKTQRNVKLRQLGKESADVKEVLGGQEFQSIEIEGEIFTTANKKEFASQPKKIERMRKYVDGTYNNGYFTEIDKGTITNILESKDKEYSYKQYGIKTKKKILNPQDQNFGECPHAEIILLARVIRQVFDKGFMQMHISLAGRLVPCQYCQQIINRFIIANRGRLTLDYIRAEQSEKFHMFPQRAPDSYSNALTLQLADIVDEVKKETTTLDGDPRRKEWLRRMVDVIEFQPKVSV